MKKEKIITICILGLVVLGFGAFKIFSNDSSDKLCVYEIPNHIKLTCPNGNETRVVNSFQTTIFEYNNAVLQGCVNLEKLNDSGYRYEIAVCNESIPFDIFN